MGSLIVMTAGIIAYNIILAKYCKNNEIHFSRWFVAGSCAFACYLAVVFEITGAGTLLDIGRHAEANVNLMPFKELMEHKDVMMNMFLSVANAILFMPLGVLLPSLWEKFESFSNTMWTGFVLSLTIEMSQLLNIRATDVNDLAMNTLGTAIGYMAYCLLFKRFASKVKLKGNNSDKPLMQHDAQLLICMMFCLNFFIAPFVDKILNRMMLGL